MTDLLHSSKFYCSHFQAPAAASVNRCIPSLPAHLGELCCTCWPGKGLQSCRCVCLDYHTPDITERRVYIFFPSLISPKGGSAIYSLHWGHGRLAWSSPQQDLPDHRRPFSISVVGTEHEYIILNAGIYVRKTPLAATNTLFSIIFIQVRFTIQAHVFPFHHITAGDVTCSSTFTTVSALILCTEERNIQDTNNTNN